MKYCVHVTTRMMISLISINILCTKIDFVSFRTEITKLMCRLSDILSNFKSINSCTSAVVRTCFSVSFTLQIAHFKSRRLLCSVDDQLRDPKKNKHP